MWSKYTTSNEDCPGYMIKDTNTAHAEMSEEKAEAGRPDEELA